MTDGEILALLRSQNPTKVYSIGRHGEIVESYPERPFQLSSQHERPRDEAELRAARQATLGSGAVARA